MSIYGRRSTPDRRLPQAEAGAVPFALRSVNIRYGPPSSHVGVRAFGDRAHATIEVSDRGPGIAPEHHKHLFERFYRVDPGRSSALGGSGLGLAMARWSVEVHGGAIEVVSAEGAGATFRIVLPRVLPANNPEHSDS